MITDTWLDEQYVRLNRMRNQLTGLTFDETVGWIDDILASCRDTIRTIADQQGHGLAEANRDLMQGLASVQSELKLRTAERNALMEPLTDFVLDPDEVEDEQRDEITKQLIRLWRGRAS